MNAAREPTINLGYTPLHQRPCTHTTAVLVFTWITWHFCLDYLALT